MGVYDRLGVRPVINATCHWTDYGGALMWPDVIEAMADARRSYVNVHDLIDRAGPVISGYTHAEATHIVSGCAAGLLAGAAAIMTGNDVVKMAALPHTAGVMKHEFVAHRFARRRDESGREYPVWSYAQAVRTAGGVMVEVGDDGGVTREALAGAIGPKTAGVYWLSDDPAAGISLAEVVEVAHEHRVPVLVDASNTLPPAEHLHHFVDLGVDLVSYSGGKGLRGPQGSGFLTGRGDLIRAARRQSSPNDGVGRSLKVSKEEMVGLVTAIEIWSQRDHARDLEDAKRRTHHVVGKLADVAGARVEYRFPDHIGRPYPTVFVHLDPARGRTGRQVIDALLAGEPSIATMDYADPYVVRVDVRILEDDQVELVARRLREVLTTP
ncbi:MAG: D-glucosaminate-6-phosphate ammonia-lyase [Thermomicrobiales bacterium]|jgi:L-seryl-tRNA(Ser) seleniumtransferase|nr:D-glucosaminate-6-phosphate ammonia-lyase [Thermomicrobiales bacterium]